ncbi:type II toxin-antitoxin system PemK/MazF family toxin [Simplicispira suum]|uniref:Growth inhibitor PemK n=1 Tax=Simplicispira suum TaxID=2109915 RepID=A0A2S0N3A6_9BURK|nr:type II toxin-antitoxin system PemK/MazF family toxin [Simplicispira suum]AVO42451.1 growth inhibitor PemK [Simplicispira suum]
MKRGDLVTIAMQGDFGKPRPALVIQADHFNEHATVTVLPVTSALVAAPLLRIPLQANAENGLQKPSQVMVDKTMTVKRDKLGSVFGQIDSDAMVEVERCLAVFLGIAK